VRHNDKLGTGAISGAAGYLCLFSLSPPLDTRKISSSGAAVAEKLPTNPLNRSFKPDRAINLASEQSNETMKKEAERVERIRETNLKYAYNRANCPEGT
jgi:hypothetical protein